MTTGRSRPTAAVVLLAAVLAGCGGGDDVAGSGNKSPNAPACGISGTVVADGLPARDVRAVLYRITENDTGYVSWAPCDTAVSGADGAFSFDTVAAGEYSIDFRKDGYGAFSGYLSCAGPDDGIALDTVRLVYTYTIIGMFRETVYGTMSIGLVGTDGYADATGDSAYISQERFFVVDNVAEADYRMTFELISDNGPPMYLETGFPAMSSLDADTSYNEQFGSVVSTVRLQDGLIRIDNALFTLVCLIEAEVAVSADTVATGITAALSRLAQEDCHE